MVFGVFRKIPVSARLSDRLDDGAAILGCTALKLLGQGPIACHGHRNLVHRARPIFTSYADTPAAELIGDRQAVILGETLRVQGCPAPRRKVKPRRTASPIVSMR